MSGGKGGSTTSSVEIPEYIERAAQENLNRAQAIAQMGYVPYYGPDVAAFTPMQEAAMQNVASAAGAFGLATPTGASVTGMPTATEYAGGIRGYSSAPMFEQAQAELAARRPAQKSYIDSFFIDPVTGQYGANAPALVDYTQFGTMAQAQRDREAADRANELAIAALQSGPQSVTYTTYGGHRDIAHDAINQAMTNYGKQIAAGTAKPEDNPAYNPDIAAANKDRDITFTTKAGTSVTKKAGELTSADFDAASSDAATQAELAAASMLAAGIRNVGGGFAQDDPTPGFGGALVDMFGGIREDLAGMPGILGGAVGMFDKDDSTYDPVGTAVLPTASNNNNDTPTVVPRPKPKPKRDDSNDSRISLPKPKPKPKPKKKSGGGGR